MGFWGNTCERRPRRFSPGPTRTWQGSLARWLVCAGVVASARFATGLTANDILPRECLDKSIMVRVADARYNMMGKRLQMLQLNVSNGQMDW